MKYILIMIWLQYGETFPPVQTEFNTESACEFARKALTDQAITSSRFKAPTASGCFAKGRDPI